MTKPLLPEGRLQSLGEEIANSLSSGIELMAVIAGIPLLVDSAIQRRNQFSLAGAIVFLAAGGSDPGFEDRRNDQLAES